MLSERFGWDGPPDGVKGAHDYLPLVIQAQGSEPEMFELPPECARPVQIHHLKSLQTRYHYCFRYRLLPNLGFSLFLLFFEVEWVCHQHLPNPPQHFVSF